MSTRDQAVLWLNGRKGNGAGGATAGGGNVLLTTPKHKLDGPEHQTADDTTTLDATTDQHGLMPKLSGDAADVFRGDGSQAPVAADEVTYDNGSSGLSATDVQAAIDELAAGFGIDLDQTYLAHGNTGATETFDASAAGWHSATLDANCTVTFTGATSGEVASMVLELTQDGTGSRTVTWPGSVVWPGGSAPTLSTAAGATDLLMFFSRDGGTNWFGFLAGGGGGGSALEVLDEGVSLDAAVTSIDFVGAGVTATNTGHAITVTVPGGATALDDLSDVTITSPAPADRLRYNGSAWLNSALIWTPMTVFDPTTGNYLPLVDGSGNQVMTEV